VLGVIPK